MRSPSRSGRRRSRTSPFVRTSTACSASLGPIARAASRPVAPSGSSSSVLSGRMTFTMEKENTQAPSGQDPDETEEGSPVPDPEQDDGGDTEDVPEAD